MFNIFLFVLIIGKSEIKFLCMSLCFLNFQRNISMQYVMFVVKYIKYVVGML